MKTIGGTVRAGNLVLILSGVLFILLGITTTFSTGLGQSIIVLFGIPVSNVIMIIFGFLLIILALRTGAKQSIVKTGQ